MKKIYLIVSTFAIGSLSFGQMQKTLMDNAYQKKLSVSTDVIKTTVNPTEKVGGDVLFTEEFTGSAGAWTTSGTDGAIWLYDTNGPNGDYSGPTQIITSPTASTGFMIFDSDLANSPGGAATWTGNLESPVVDLSTVPGAVLTFYQSYRTCCSNAFYPKIEVSTDDFTTVEEFDVTEIGVGVNDNSGTVQMTVNLSSYLATATNKTNFRFRFVWTGASHYFWQIDDIQIAEAHDFDIALNTLWLANVVNEYEHTDFPSDFDKTLTVQGQVVNLGHTLPTGTTITVKVLNESGTIVATETGGTLSNDYSKSKDTITFATAINLNTLGGIGTYTVIGDLNIQETDAIADNDTMFRTLNLTDFYLGQRNYEYNRSAESIGKLAGTSPNSSEMTFGNVMSIPASITTIDLQALEITLARTATYPVSADQEIEIKLYEMDYNAGGFSETHVDMGDSRIFNIASSDIPANNGFKDVLFNFNHAVGATGPMQLEGGKDYFIGIYASGGTKHLAYAVNPTDDDGSSHIFGPFGTSNAISWFTNGTQIHTRMNFDTSLGLNAVESENIQSVSIYPNPTINSTTVSYSLTAATDVKVEIVDITGKIVYSSYEGQQDAGRNTIAIDVEDYNKGIYYVNIITNESKVTQKFVKK